MMIQYMLMRNAIAADAAKKELKVKITLEQKSIRIFHLKNSELKKKYFV